VRHPVPRGNGSRAANGPVRQPVRHPGRVRVHHARPWAGPGQEDAVTGLLTVRPTVRPTVPPIVPPTVGPIATLG